jgi:hypothetical protein
MEGWDKALFFAQMTAALLAIYHYISPWLKKRLMPQTAPLITTETQKDDPVPIIQTPLQK